MNVLTPIDSGGIILSYKCNCRCRHCLYSCGPDWQEWIDVGDVTRIFEGLLQTSCHLRGFHLAGGEPFLDFNRLLRVQRAATEFRIPIEYIETNAGWCIDEETGLDKFAQLKDAGLGCILISCSPFHAESVPLNRVEAAINAGYDVFGTNGVIVWIPQFYRQLAAISRDRTISLDEYVGSVGEGTVRYMLQCGYSLISGGRVGYELGDYHERQPPEGCSGDHCRLELLESGHAHFDPYGNLIPAFCSGISLGDVRDLPTLMKSFDLDRFPLVRTLAEDGPYGLYRFAEIEYGYRPLDTGYIGKCHLCVDVRKWIIAHTDQFRELAPAQFYARLAERLCPREL